MFHVRDIVRVFVPSRDENGMKKINNSLPSKSRAETLDQVNLIISLTFVSFESSVDDMSRVSE